MIRNYREGRRCYAAIPFPGEEKVIPVTLLGVFNGKRALVRENLTRKHKLEHMITIDKLYPSRATAMNDKNPESTAKGEKI